MNTHPRTAGVSHGFVPPHGMSRAVYSHKVTSRAETHHPAIALLENHPPFHSALVDQYNYRPTWHLLQKAPHAPHLEIHQIRAYTAPSPPVDYEQTTKTINFPTGKSHLPHH